jgi:hypothetical protein
LVDRPAQVRKIKHLHTEWWQARIARQKEIDASIAAKADSECGSVGIINHLGDEVMKVFKVT